MHTSKTVLNVEVDDDGGSDGGSDGGGGGGLRMHKWRSNIRRWTSLSLFVVDGGRWMVDEHALIN